MDLPAGAVVLTNVRLSFSSLWEPDTYNNQNPAYRATLMLEKDSADFQAQFDRVMAAIRDVAAQAWPSQHESLLKSLYAEGKIAFKDGDKFKPEYFAGSWFVSARRPEKNGPPLVLDNTKDELGRWRQLTPPEGPRRIYDGCYVNAMVRFWAQDPEGRRPSGYGKRINAALESVQFRAPGEAFGAKITPEMALSAFTDDMVPEDVNNAFAPNAPGGVPEAPAGAGSGPFDLGESAPVDDDDDTPF